MDYEDSYLGVSTYLIMGSHVYQTPGTEVPIVVYVTGPDGTSDALYPQDLDYANVTSSTPTPSSTTPSTQPPSTQPPSTQPPSTQAPSSVSAYPTPQPNYGVAPLSERVPMRTPAQREVWRQRAMQLANDMQSFLPPGDNFRVTSIIKPGEHNSFEKMDVARTQRGVTTWEELANAAYRAGFWVHAEGVTLGGVHWPLSPRATGPHLDLYYLRQ